jgi:hypothetical protein
MLTSLQEEATEMGHMKQIQQGVRSTTKKSNRGRPSKEAAEGKAAMEDAISITKQEPRNEKTHIVYMTAVKAEGLIARDQTGMFPWTSNRGNKYICIFYVCDSNFIKGVRIKSKKRGSYSKHTRTCMHIVSKEASNLCVISWTRKRPRT